MGRWWWGQVGGQFPSLFHLLDTVFLLYMWTLGAFKDRTGTGWTYPSTCIMDRRRSLLFKFWQAGRHGMGILVWGRFPLRHACAACFPGTICAVVAVVLSLLLNLLLAAPHVPAFAPLPHPTLPFTRAYPQLAWDFTSPTSNSVCLLIYAYFLAFAWRDLYPACPSLCRQCLSPWQGPDIPSLPLTDITLQTLSYHVDIFHA